MERWLLDCVTDIRAHTSTDDEGSLWAMFFSERDRVPVITSVFNGAADEADDEFIRGIATLISGVGADGCLFAITRHKGKPVPDDLRLWRSLRTITGTTRTRALGLVVVGSDRHCTATDELDSGALTTRS
jgi:hypothetical protein